MPKLVSPFLSLGHLLTRFADKGISYRITSNPIERTIVWNMAVPEEVSLVIVCFTCSSVTIIFLYIQVTFAYFGYFISLHLMFLVP